MILPVYTYGQPVLKKTAKDIDKNYQDLDKLIENMKDTMNNAEGVGLAAPQIGLSIRLIVIDASAMAEDEKSLEGFKKVLINPKIIEEKGVEWAYTEGCLSVPDIREEIKRKPEIRIQYYDQDFNFFDEEYEGIKARIIQHEYDHLEGKLLVDRINPLRKRLLNSKLKNIIKGKIDVKYKIKPVKK